MRRSGAAVAGPPVPQPPCHSPASLREATGCVIRKADSPVPMASGPPAAFWSVPTASSRGAHSGPRPPPYRQSSPCWRQSSGLLARPVHQDPCGSCCAYASGDIGPKDRARGARRTHIQVSGRLVMNLLDSTIRYAIPALGIATRWLKEELEARGVRTPLTESCLKELVTDAHSQGVGAEV